MELDLNKAITSDYPMTQTVIAGTPDSAAGQHETIWQNDLWAEQWGAFTEVAEYQNTLLMMGKWNTGKGWDTDPETEVILNNFDGWGKDTFSDIMLNLDVMSIAAGDSFAHIIRVDQHDRASKIVNLKPLNPGRMRIVVGEDGRIVRYEQMGPNPKDVFKKFQPHEIFHLCYNRMADQIHGTAIYRALKKIILADEKSFEIMDKVMRHQAVPFILWHLKTDDDNKVAGFAEKVRKVKEKYDDLFIPDDENIATHDIIELNPSSIIMEWRDELRNKFYRAVGLPQIIPGASGQSSSTDERVVYLAFEQLVTQRQLYLKNQIWKQLVLKVVFNPPTTMADLIGNDERKDAGGNFNVQPSEVAPSQETQ